MFFDTLSFEGSEIICIAMFLIVEEEGNFVEVELPEGTP
jgi:hypothetical protein